MKNPWRTLIHRIVVMYRNNSISRLFKLKYQFNKVIIENRQTELRLPHIISMHDWIPSLSLNPRPIPTRYSNERKTMDTIMTILSKEKGGMEFGGRKAYR